MQYSMNVLTEIKYYFQPSQESTTDSPKKDD